MNNKLIIIRGPSASGKTTLANRLLNASKSKMVLIRQDDYRFIFSQTDEGSRANSELIHKMIEYNTSISLLAGYDVIIEGILSNKSYQDILERLIASHKGESFAFYFDLSFEETLIRHKTKSNVAHYGENEMRSWYSLSQRLNRDREYVIPEHMTEDQIYHRIVGITGLDVQETLKPSMTKI
jgi:predicted kinase